MIKPCKLNGTQFFAFTDTKLMDTSSLGAMDRGQMKENRTQDYIVWCLKDCLCQDPCVCEGCDGRS